MDKTLNDTSFQKVLFHDFRDVVHRDTAIEDISRIDDHDGAQFAETETSGLDYFDLILEALFLDLRN